MFRIDHPTAVASIPAPAALGTQGFFTKGDPAFAVPATRVTQDWLNAIQEEVCNAIEGAGFTLDKGNRGQLLASMLKLTDSSGLSNLAINPTFQVVQRTGLSPFGTSADNTEKFLVYDRWQFKAGGGAETATVVAAAVDGSLEETPSKVERYLDFNKASAGVSGVKPTIATRLENVVAFGGRPVVFAFDAKKLSGSDFSFDGVEAVQDFGTGGGASADVTTQLASIGALVCDGSWRRFIFTATLPTTVGKTITTGHHVAFRLRLPANTALRFGVSAFTISRTTKDPGFVERPDMLERILCCRFFEVQGAQFNLAGTELNAYWNTADDFTAPENPLRTMSARFLATKRGVLPTVTWYSTDGTANAVREGDSTNHTVDANSFLRSVSHTGYPDFTAPPAAGQRHFRGRFVADAELV